MAGIFPVAEQIAAQTLSLPLFPELREDEIKYVSGAVNVNSSNILTSAATEYDQNTIKNNSLYH